ncbi:hypothetical protein GDO81_009344 [Engystomops pustulosus]|uniref:Uncharacterized protein n=1 Tax=Engystomops pustulosus TaxID=76066 RepID=A0AAV7BRB6_ENGPU|nr:hypothetical protein GDO81_009344 [Engystomops pustulosus]
MVAGVVLYTSAASPPNTASDAGYKPPPISTALPQYHKHMVLVPTTHQYWFWITDEISLMHTTYGFSLFALLVFYFSLNKTEETS